MPLTLPTHPLAVVPLKLWRPRWFDGVALVLGAISPDLSYWYDGYGATIHSHAWHAPLWWALPIVLVLSRVVRWAAPTVAAHLPDGDVLALRDYGALANARHRWYVTASSAVIGAASHIVWDAFTHPRVDGGRVLLPALHAEVSPGLPWWYLLSTVSDLIGFVAATALIVHIGRKRLVRRWHGPAVLPPARPAVFWSAGLLALVPGLALLPVQPSQSLPVLAIDVLIIAMLALLLGSVAVRVRATYPASGAIGGAGSTGDFNPAGSIEGPAGRTAQVRRL